MRNVAHPTRPYQLYFEHRPGYLFAYVHSEVTSYEIAKGYWMEILSMIHHRKYQKVLVEKDVVQRLSAHDVFDIVTELAQSQCNKCSFAIFDHYYNAEKCHFEEMVGTNRDLNIRILNDMEFLETWLMTQPDDPSYERESPPIMAQTYESARRHPGARRLH